MIRDIYIALPEPDGGYREPPSFELGVSVVGGVAYLERVELSGDKDPQRRQTGPAMTVPAQALLRALQAAIADEESSVEFLREHAKPPGT
ncbi:hypothetical protein [Amycolatopsis sp. FDAARGOS 1241]|uniref:hypothetical protein n=1 Tax=Amycolatopsis sp. FDAARGOS 1241 TaxID=2778070 RepID=UPI0019520FCA|nr:hypothetical protein [Amycolatopsis sp. FDAARGOS 1241]QRP47956.1 hypothetical protein I6J71_08715 [Amycolatopsis sp. FDAARGOS 1241]